MPQTDHQPPKAKQSAHTTQSPRATNYFSKKALKIRGFNCGVRRGSQSSAKKNTFFTKDQANFEGFHKKRSVFSSKGKMLGQCCGNCWYFTQASSYIFERICCNPMILRMSKTIYKHPKQLTFAIKFSNVPLGLGGKSEEFFLLFTSRQKTGSEKYIFWQKKQQQWGEKSFNWLMI